MPKESNIDFLPIIIDVFESVFNDYSFQLLDNITWNGQGENILTALKKEIELNFYVGTSPLFYYCSVGIKLTEETAKKMSLNSKNYNIGVSAIAKELDPSYKQSRKGAQTVEEVRNLFEAEKKDLLKYCEDILLGDVSSLIRVVNQMSKEKERNN